MSSQSISTDELCDVCGRAETVLRSVTRGFGSGASLLVIESIPMITCPHCGASYFTARTMHEIERIKTLRKTLASERAVPVARFV
jgi:YgiT-type zinc finger domain-containing protein